MRKAPRAANRHRPLPWSGANPPNVLRGYLPEALPAFTPGSSWDSAKSMCMLPHQLLHLLHVETRYHHQHATNAFRASNSVCCPPCPSIPHPAPSWYRLLLPSLNPTATATLAQWPCWPLLLLLLCWLPRLLSLGAPLLLLPAVELQDVSTAQLPPAMLSTSIQQGVTAAASPPAFLAVLPLPDTSCCPSWYTAVLPLLQCWLRRPTKADGCGNELATRKATRLPLLL